MGLFLPIDKENCRKCDYKEFETTAGLFAISK